VNVSLERLKGLLLTKEIIFLPNPPLEQSFDQLELLDEEKIGGETMVSLLKFIGSMVLEYMALNERGCELFKGDFLKLFKLEHNPLYET